MRKLTIKGEMNSMIKIKQIIKIQIPLMMIKIGNRIQNQSRKLNSNQIIKIKKIKN